MEQSNYNFQYLPCKSYAVLLLYTTKSYLYPFDRLQLSLAAHKRRRTQPPQKEQPKK